MNALRTYTILSSMNYHMHKCPALPSIPSTLPENYPKRGKKTLWSKTNLKYYLSSSEKQFCIANLIHLWQDIELMKNRN